ncbi:MAG TPA: RidA family protein [Pseudonocardiaceae bacterium]|jgi:enamine deaminase RidA (YjgF/YER057c/UK114 family)
MPIESRTTTVAGVATSPNYAHAVTVTGRIAFVAGQIALDANGELVGAGDVTAQAAQALANLHAVIRELGADWADVVKFGWYVVDAPTGVPAVRAAIERQIVPVLGTVRPASTLVQVAGLFRPDLLVEVDATVALPD